MFAAEEVDRANEAKFCSHEGCLREVRIEVPGKGESWCAVHAVLDFFGYENLEEYVEDLADEVCLLERSDRKECEKKGDRLVFPHIVCEDHRKDLLNEKQETE